VLGGEGLHLSTETVADLLEQRWRRDREAEMSGEEGDHLTTYLQIGDVGVEQQAVDAVDRQTDVTVEHVVDVHDTCHAQRDSA